MPIVFSRAALLWSLASPPWFSCFGVVIAPGEVFFSCVVKRYITSCDGTARDGQVTLTRSDVCISTRRDTASCVFVGCALHTAVGFARTKAGIERECRVCERVPLLERIVNHPPRLVGIYGFESVVLYLTDAAQRCIERLSEIIALMSLLMSLRDSSLFL